LPWNPDAKVSSINSLKIAGDGVFIAGSGLQSLSGIFVNNFAYVSLYTALPVQLFPEIGFQNIFTMETYGEDIYLAGDFRILGGKYHPYFASLSFQQLNFKGGIQSVNPLKGASRGM